jgi:coproporphyrinogen III oxidase
MSMPPAVNFEYQKEIIGKQENKLYDYYLQPKDWV